VAPRDVVSARLIQRRIEDLEKKLVQRIRPFVDAKNPGDLNDPETKAFEARIRTEAEDLKLESFGIEVGCRGSSSSQSPYRRSR
jgi:hypothetical protein